MGAQRVAALRTNIAVAGGCDCRAAGPTGRAGIVASLQGGLWIPASWKQSIPALRPRIFFSRELDRAGGAILSPTCHVLPASKANDLRLRGRVGAGIVAPFASREARARRGAENSNTDETRYTAL
jgi:hypothetical protein